MAAEPPIVTVEDPGSYCLSPDGYATTVFCSQFGGCMGDHPTGKRTCVVVDGEHYKYSRTEGGARRMAYRVAKHLGGVVSRG